MNLRNTLLVAVVVVMPGACANAPTCNADADCFTNELCVAGACAVIVDAPVLAAVPASLSTLEDTMGTVPLAVADVAEGAAVDFVLLAPATLGHAVVDGAVLRYTPSPETSGAEELSFAPLCGGKLGRPALIDVEIRAVDDGPVLSVSGPEDIGGGVLQFSASATDREGQSIAFTAAFDAGASEVRPGEDGMALVEYTPAADFHGEDNGVITATDDGGAFASRAVVVDVR